LRAWRQSLGEGVRRSLLLSAGAPAAGYGLMLLDEENRLEMLNADAEWLLGELVERGRPPDQLPSSIHSVATCARQLATTGVSPDARPASARARTRSGAWLTLHSTCLHRGACLRTAVVIEPSRPPEIASLLLQAYGLSPRELEVAQLLLVGCSVPHIARLLQRSVASARARKRGPMSAQARGRKPRTAAAWRS
jgi:hypothetical protein